MSVRKSGMDDGPHPFHPLFSSQKSESVATFTVKYAVFAWLKLFLVGVYVGWRQVPETSQ